MKKTKTRSASCFKMNNKKSQMKIQQMAFMLVAVTLFFVLVGLFVLGIGFSGLKQSSETLEKENAVLLVSELANSPEFSCGEVYKYGDSYCVDEDKVMALKNMDEYSNFWDVNSIEIRKVYPSENEIECSKENYPDCNVIKVYSRGSNQEIFKSSFISLCRKEKVLETGENYDKCEIGKLLVSYEVQK